MKVFKNEDITINTLIQSATTVILFILMIMFDTNNDQQDIANAQQSETNRILIKLTAEVAKLNTLTETNRLQIKYVNAKADKNKDSLNQYIINHHRDIQ